MGEQTKKNLMEAFAGESQARNKYTFFAEVAQAEGWQQVAEIFREAAENEKYHAKILLRTAVGIGKTVENLKAAIAGENEEYQSMYPEFAKIAKEEGDNEAAALCEKIASVEKHHSEVFQAALKELEAGTLLKKEKPIQWRCRVCGYIVTSNEPPELCPLCSHKKAYYRPTHTK